MTDVSILMPAYNEGRAITETLENVSESLASVTSFEEFEIVVVDDGSSDATDEYLSDVERRRKSVESVTYTENRGKGFALRRGFAEVDGDLVLFADADPDLNPAQIETFVQILEDGEVDVVVGSKRHPNSEVEYPVARRVLSKGYALLTRALFDVDVRDTQVGMKLFRREVLEDVFPLLLVEEFAFDIELLALARERGYELAEAPISLNFQGDSSIDWSAVARMGWDTLAVFYRQRVIEYYDRVERGEREPIAPAPKEQIAAERRSVTDGGSTDGRSHDGRRTDADCTSAGDDKPKQPISDDSSGVRSARDAPTGTTDQSDGRAQRQDESSSVVR